MRFLPILLLFTSFSFAQEIFRNDGFNFSMQVPEKWFKGDEGLTDKNLKDNLAFSEAEMDKLIENNKGSVEVVTFYKYDIKSVKGVIPTIKVIIRKNPTKTPEQFRKLMDYSMENIKASFPKIKITLPPTDRKIGGKDAVYFEAMNVIPTKSGEQQVRTASYAVAVGSRFFQINFMDTPADDNQTLFEELVKTIKL